MHRQSRVWLLVVSLTSLLVIYSYRSILAVSNDSSPKKRLSSSSVVVRKMPDEFATFDDWCETHGEWETLGEDVFVKRSGGFFFHDATLLHLHLIQMTDKVYSFQAEISLIDLRDSSRVLTRFNTSHNQTMTRMQWQIGEYNSSVITSRVNVPIQVKDWSDIKMSVRLYDLVSGLRTKSRLNVALRRLNGDFNQKKGNILCAKSFHLKKHDLLTLRWWIELNKQIGYDKIYMWNHDIERESGTFDRLFRDAAYKDFVTLDKLDCLPNLQRRLTRFQNQTYLKHHTDLVYGEHTYEILKYELINQLLLNECYLNHIDKYRYVTICDIDETVIPKKTKLLSQRQVVDFIRSGSKIDDVTCDRYDSINLKENKKTLESYMNELARLENIKEPMSYHVKHGFYLYNSIAKKVFDSISTILNEHSTLDRRSSSSQTQNQSNASYNYLIQVSDFVDEPKMMVNFSFTIRTEQEMQYATRLHQIYTTTIEPYLNTHSRLIQSHVRDFDRLFFVGDRASFFACGKTIHDTRSTFDLSVHFVEHRILNQLDVDYNKSNPFKSISYDLAHLSHFRRELAYLSSHYQRLSIESFKLDVNYFLCYFKPILEKFSSNPLV